jgi:hypothetical protein
MRQLLLTTLLLAAACKPKAHGDMPLPPPIEDGKCLADFYQNNIAIKQTCIYTGYMWGCQYNPGTGHACTRGAEAAGERTK